MREPFNTIPKWLQRMLLALQTYDLEGRETIFLADTLSRVYLPEVNACEVAQDCESVDHRSSLPVTGGRWQQLLFASANDPVMQQSRNVIQQGWPGDRSEVPECVRPYFDSRDELTTQDSLVFKRHLLVVPICDFAFPNTNFVKALLAMLSALLLVAGSKHATCAFGSATWQAGASSDQGIHKTNQNARKVN